MSIEPIRVERREGWRKLVLNRPDKLNAANEAMLTALLARAGCGGGGSRLPRAAADRRGTRLLCRPGAGAGGDAWPGRRRPISARSPTCTTGWCAGCARVPLPVVCAVNGVAAGAGASYALACDIVLAARSAKFIQAFVKIGLVPDSGASFFLPRLIGEARARALAMLGEPVDAANGRSLGDDLEGGGRCGAAAGSRGADRASGEAADRGAGGDEAHVRGIAPPTGWMRSSTWSATARRRRGAVPTTPRACARSWRSARRCSGGAHERAGAHAPRRCGRRIAPARAGHASGRGGAGHARLSMTITEAMANGHGICHGGFIFALADSAMAFAANPHGEAAVAQHARSLRAPGTSARCWWRRRRTDACRPLRDRMTCASARRMANWSPSSAAITRIGSGD